MHGSFARNLGCMGVFCMSMVLMVFVCTWAWDTFVNGKLYYCTDGGTMDFILVGDWVHHPEAVAHVVPRSMEQLDEIKNGWSITGLWCIWGAFVGGSVFLSALFAGALLRVTSPNNRTATNPAMKQQLQPGNHWRRVVDPTRSA
jgi:hypothetical protein